MHVTRTIVLALTLAVIVSGCWDRREIENTAFVMAIGIDKAEAPDKYKVTAQISIASQVAGQDSVSQEQRPSNWVLTATGKTVFEAVRNLTQQSPRLLVLSNLRVIVFGEELARDEGIRDVLDVFDRDSEPRRRAWILVSKGVAASEIMRTSVPISLLTVDAIEDMMSISAKRTGTIVARSLHEVLQTLAAPGSEVYVSPIEVLTEQNTSPDQSQLPQGITPTHHPRVGGAALFKGTRLVGWLDETATRGLLFARNEVSSASLVTACDPKGEGLMTIEVLSSKGSVTPQFKDGKLSAKIAVQALGNIGDMNCDPRAHIDVLNERFAKAIEEDIRKALDALQKEFAVDALALGLSVYQRLPHVWKQVEDDWEAVFAEVPIEIEVKSMLQRQGLISNVVEVR